MATVLDIQVRLQQLGFDPGGLDGRGGTRTIRAIKAFQLANGLAADGRVGPLTTAELFGDDARETEEPETAPPQPSTAAGGDWPRQADCMTCYGGVGLFQTKLALPYPMRLAWDKNVVVETIPVHEKVHDSAARVFQRIAAHYSEAQRRNMGLDLFGGSLNVRRMRGGKGYSMHSWGIAIDFDPERNQLKWGRDRARLAQTDADAFWRFWEAEGWVSLGRARNFDWMHVQAARL